MSSSRSISRRMKAEALAARGESSPVAKLLSKIHLPRPKAAPRKKAK